MTTATLTRVASQDSTRAAGVTYVRGSTLILLGKTISQAVEFGVQIFLIRYFSKADFGAIAYALSIVFLLRALALFEMPIAVSRYLPAYRHRARGDLVLGGTMLGLGIVAALGTLIATCLALGVGVLGLSPTSDEEAIRVLLILAALVPIDALDILVTSLFATLVGARQIFVRQAIVGPALRILLVLAVVATNATVVAFAAGYVAVSAITLAVYGAMFARVVRQDPELGRPGRARRSYPSREMLTFAAPLLASTLVWLLLDSSDAVLLGFFHDIEEVADFRAVVPLALATQGVMLAFTILYAPTLARHVAEGTRGAVTHLYWRSALWVTLASFPIFILTFSFAPTTVGFVLGEDYESSAPVLAILAVGYFVHLALGFNGMTLRVLGKVRYSVAIDIGAAVFNVGINLLLIPTWGAVGAAVGTAATLVIHNVLKQAGLWYYTGIPPLAAGYRAPYVTVTVVAAVLAAAAIVAPPAPWVAALCATLAGLVIVWANRERLELAATFPQLARFLHVRRAAPSQ
jgi:O-antigen/teichoic acid export membrane protein